MNRHVHASAGVQLDGDFEISTWRDRLFQAAFSRTFAFTMLLEDAEVDERHFGVAPGARVLSISGAGCSVAGMLAARPRSLDVVDSNRHHLAITALKLAAASRLRSHDELYALLGRGRHPAPERLLPALLQDSPPWVRAYWGPRARLFRDGFYGHGLLGRALGALRRMSGTDGAWMRRMSAAPLEERRRELRARLLPVLRRPSVAALLRSPLFLLANGINYVQRQRNLRADRTEDVVDVVDAYLLRIAETDLRRNWIAWSAAAGEFNHDDPDAVPPYLRRDRHARSLDAQTEVRLHDRNIFDVLASSPDGTFTHINLCDAIDWMPAETQRRLLAACARVLGPGGVLLFRSVEDRGLVEELGLAARLRRLDAASERASAEDRTRLYRRVELYRVAQ